MPTLATLRRYGPRILIGIFSLATIVSEMVLFFKGLDRTKDLSSDAALARFLPMAIMTILFVGIQLQRLTVCFTSTTILVQLAFYVWAVECFLKVSILFGTIALLSFNKDFADKMKAKRRDSREYFLPAPVLCILFYGTFVVGISLRMILNELRKRDWEAERQREALLRIEKDMPPFPITTANRALMEKEAQKQLLRVRTWPRVFIGLYYAAELLDIANILLFKRDKLAELRWHVHLLNIVITICALNGLYALFRKSLRISRGCFSTYVAILFYDSYFRIKNLIKLYRNGNVSSSSIITTAADALTTEDSTVMKFPFAEAVLNAIVDFFLDLLLVWSMWQIVKDLEKRNERIAKAKFESRVAASNTTITDEKGATVYNERGQQSSVMWI